MLAAHQGIGMDLDIDAFELGQRRIDDGVQGLAGGVRDQMDMKFLLHKLFPIAPRSVPYALFGPLWTTPNRDACARPCRITGHGLGQNGLVAPSLKLLSPLSLKALDEADTNRSLHSSQASHHLHQPSLKSLVMKVASVKLGIVLFNLGGPDGPEAVEPFLRNLFSDPAIISLPAIVRKPLARFIARRRAPVARRSIAISAAARPSWRKPRRRRGRWKRR